MKELVRFSKENMNLTEALKGKWGSEGYGDVFLTVLKNVLLVVALPGAVADIDLPEVYDGFLVCSDGSTLPVTDSKLTISLGTGTSAQGILKLVNDN